MCEKEQQKEYFEELDEARKLISEQQAKETLNEEARQKLVESVSLLRSFFNSPGAMRGVVEIEGNDIRHITDNSITAEFFGRTQESMRHMLASEMGVDQDFIDMWIAHYEESKRIKQEVNFEYEHKLGQQSHFFSVTVNYLGESDTGFSKYTYVVFDITEHKQAQQALQKANDELDRRVEMRTIELAQSNEQLKKEIEVRRLVETALRHERDRAQSYLDTVEAIIVVLNRSGRIKLINQKGCRLLGYDENELIGQHWFSHCLPQPEGLQKVFPSFSKLITGETEGRKYDENPIISRKGELRQIAWHNKVLRDEGGRIIGTLSSGEDITERKAIEMALKSEKEHLAVTLRSIGDAVIATDRQGNITLVNHVAEKLTGWRESYAVGRPLPEVFNIVDELTRKRRQNPVQEVIGTGKIITLADHTLLIDRDGIECLIAYSGAPILDPEKRIIGVVLVFRDITKAQRLEAELLKMEKLKSLGVLAGGIAHDFNNFLSGIAGNISLAKLDVKPTDEIYSRLQEMEKATMRAKDLTQQLLTFSKGGEPVKRLTRLDVLVKEAALFAIRGSNVDCHFDFRTDLWPAQVDESQIAQAIHNLIFNADQAMPEGGTISISGQNVSLGAERHISINPGKYVKLSVRDRGTGIQPEHLQKIFDPYFTTKHKGSGLGMAVTHSIIEKHSGRITVFSKLGSGTTFHIYLPALPEKAAESAVNPDTLTNGSGRILIMDDEDFIQSMASQMLVKMGYESAVACDGAEAFRLYCEAMEADQPFDAVILDLTIPGGMGGKETIQKLLTIDAQVSAIVSSGYSNDPVIADFKAYGFKAAVKKPYLIQDMDKALRTVLEDRRKSHLSDED